MKKLVDWITNNPEVTLLFFLGGVVLLVFIAAGVELLVCGCDT